MVTRLMTLAQREAFFHTLEKNNPNPQTELEYASPFQLLAAVLLSAQATDISVNKATRKLFAVARTPQAIFALGEDGLVPFIQTIGLYRTKAKHLIATCEILIKQFGGEVPQNRESLESLPGVGRKTANVVLNTAFNDGCRYAYISGIKSNWFSTWQRCLGGRKTITQACTKTILDGCTSLVNFIRALYM